MTVAAAGLHCLRRVVPTLMLLLAASATAASAPESCPLPRHAVASEDAAVDAVIKAVDAYGLLHMRRLSMDCVAFVSDQNQREPRYSVTLREKHDAQCGGDPIVEPRVFTVNVASNGRMTTDAYDMESDQPLRCPKHGASTPEDVVYDFYRWYLTQDRVTHDPIFSGRKMIKRYVSRVLLHRADINQWTCDYDYFTQAQQFDAVWINTIALDHAHIHGNKAKVSVTLGERAIDARVAKLTLTLKREDGWWKITDVHDDYPEHWDIENAARDKEQAQEIMSQQANDQSSK